MKNEYSTIIQKIQNSLLLKGYNQNDIAEAFGPAKEEKLHYLTDLFGTFAHCTEFYTEDDYINLTQIQLPDSIINFYRESEPHYLPILNGGIRLLGLDAIKDENCTGAPGMYLIRFGVLVFATTIGGNAICMDLQEIKGDSPRIVICESNFCSYNEDCHCVEAVWLPDEIAAKYEPDEPVVLTYELLKKCLPEVSPSFGSFLLSIANNQYTDIEEQFLKK
jgi:hypothetical protein